MKIDINLSAVASALMIMAAVSLFVMVALTQIDHIVHGVLYNFGLQFSYRWAIPYWTNSGIIIGLSWFNIAASIVLAYHVLKRRKRSQGLEVEAQIVEEEETPQRKLVEYVTPQEKEPIDTAEKFAQQPTEVPAEDLHEPSGELISAQISEEHCELPKLQIKKYDVRHPKEVVDSQC